LIQPQARHFLRVLPEFFAGADGTYPASGSVLKDQPFFSPERSAAASAEFSAVGVLVDEDV
jgi:hypothetical protein